MGYTTDFSGAFDLSPALNAAQIAYLKLFANTRRMMRSVTLVGVRPDPVRVAVGLPVGIEGEYFVGSSGYAGQEHSSDVVDFNCPPSTQPGLWCQWEPTDDGTKIQWNGVEKFYSYTEWLQYLIDNFLNKWGITITGEVRYQGEESADFGRVVVVNGIASRLPGKRVF